jgi:hypothetical protein
MRPTGESVILILTVGLSCTLMIVSAGLVVAALVQPERDLTGAIDAVTRLLTAMLGIVIGYVAGLRRENGRSR